MRLRFTPQERTFYDNILGRTLRARSQWSQHQQAAMGAGGEDGGTAITVDDPPSGALTGGRGAGGGRRHHPRGRGASSAQDQGKELERIAKTELLQLRIACIHPQLTAYWKELSSELQLQVGREQREGQI